MVGKIIAGSIAVVIGGSTFVIHKSDVVNNFSKNSGLTQQQAQDYVNNIKPSDLISFSKVGQSFISDGNTILSQSSGIDCFNYTYPAWESSTLSCSDGKSQFQEIGNSEITMGNCLQALDANLGGSAKAKINECITDIDTTNRDYDLPVATALLDSKTLADEKNINAYNKSVLEAALQVK